MNEFQKEMQKNIIALYKTKQDMLENHVREGCIYCKKKAIEIKEFQDQPGVEYMIFACGSMLKITEKRHTEKHSFTMTWDRTFLRKC